ncbi:MerR family transcriptional regulator [Streptococcus marmotae]|uniref:MerR family transcriptional regulator n=1 Tax=Streptococcus marmotae TaxID=1825069 RepID=UPI000834DB2B|nr:MerR family transcriptional regulator [Streptococcus marmotae]
MYLVKEVAQLSGVSIRTLHHYDRIGLLCPRKAENGYRYYTEENLAQLQQILFYRYLRFPLKNIKELLGNDTDNLAQLEEQFLLLTAEQKRLTTLIDTLAKTIQTKKGMIYMTTEEKFVGFRYEDGLAYQEEAIQKYGKEMIESSLDKQKGQEAEVTEGFNTIFQQFADNLVAGLTVEEKENQELAGQLLHHIRTYGFDCSLEVFAFIGKGYVGNPEFQRNIDKFGQGVAQYVCDTIQIYVQKESEA